MNPRPTQKELAGFYEKDYHYDDFYSEHFAKQSRQFFQETKQFYSPEEKLLDIGCSKGYFLNFAKRFGMTVRGSEFSAKAATYANKNFGIKVDVGSIDDMRYEPESFDVITAFDLVEHLPNFMTSFKQFHKWLKKDGRLIIDTPNFDSLYRKISKDRWVGFDMPYHIHLFRPKTLIKALEEAGFSVEYISTSHFNILSREGLIRSKYFGFGVLAVKLLRLFGLWENAKKSSLIQPVAHVNQEVKPKGDDQYRDPKINWLDILEAGLNAPFNYIFGRLLLWGDGLRVVVKK